VASVLPDPIRIEDFEVGETLCRPLFCDKPDTLSRLELGYAHSFLSSAGSGALLPETASSHSDAYDGVAQFVFVS